MVDTYVRIDSERCTSCGLCVESCPPIFQVDCDGTVSAIFGEIPGDLVEQCKRLRMKCPTVAIELFQIDNDEPREREFEEENDLEVGDESVLVDNDPVLR